MLVKGGGNTEQAISTLEVMLSIFIVAIALLALYQLESRSITQWRIVEDSLKTHRTEYQLDDIKLTLATCISSSTPLGLKIEECSAPNLKLPNLVLSNED